jgi:transcriptional regulator with PAS, ATPase and Fis domain
MIDEAIAVCRRKRKKQQSLNNIIMQYEYLKQEQEFHKSKLVGLSKGLKDVYSKIKSAAQYPVNVLLLGETGTGKELVANMIHELSIRRRNNFIKLNCAAIPDSLIESELFGYNKGAFTGANSSKPGKIEMTNGGTLFLDEIGEMSIDVQIKLLRVLQYKEIERIGSNKPLKVDFRLITATNKDIEKCINEGRFREDFYYRINIFPIRIPSLRERKSDIPDLVDYLVKKTCRELNIKQPSIEKDVYKKLQSYPWPGNIRELENIIMRTLIITPDKPVLHESDFNFMFYSTSVPVCNISFKKAIQVLRDEVLQKNLKVKDIDRYILKSILDYYNGNIKDAVKNTGILKDRFYRLKKDKKVKKS